MKCYVVVYSYINFLLSKSIKRIKGMSLHKKDGNHPGHESQYQQHIINTKIKRNVLKTLCIKLLLLLLLLFLTNPEDL